MHVTTRALRRFFATLIPTLLVAAMLSVIPSVVLAPAATAAAGDYDCVDTVYGTIDDTLYKVATGTGTGTRVGTFSADVNAVAVAPSGDAVYAMGAMGGTGSTSGTANLYKYGTSGAFKQIRGLNSGDTIVGGAFNPVTGHYWFETVNGGTLRFYDVNLSATSPITLSTPAMTTATGISSSTGSDFTFDSRGNAYVVFSTSGNGYTNKLMRFTAAQLAAGGSQTGTQVTTLSPNRSQFPGIGFGSDGYMYVTYGSSFYRLAPTNGAVKQTLSAGRAYNDLGSCATPAVMDTVVKDIVDRKKAGDQFRVSFSGTDLTTLTGTTAGTDLGPQTEAAEVAGPTLVLPGSTYTFEEAAAGTTTLSDYAATWECVNLNTGQVFARGSGTSGSMTTPATGADGSGAAVTCTITNEVKKPSIELTKAASGTPVKAGDQITYGFTVKNTGNTTLNSIAVTDPLLSGKTITCAATTLAAGASTNCTVSSPYAVTQANVDAGKVSNTATATGTPAGMSSVTSTSTATTTITRTSQLKIVKSSTGTPTKVGDQITYTFEVTNTGNTTVTGVGVDDDLVSGESCTPTTLAPGASATCTASRYTVTQGDVDAGSVVNTATPTGTGPSGAAAVTTDPTSTTKTTTPITATGVLTATLAQSSEPVTAAGQQITYTATVKNTGNVTVSNAGFTDDLENTYVCTPTSLAPGASATCTATYLVTQADVDAGKVDNSGDGAARTPAGAVLGAASNDVSKTITASASVEATLAQSASAVTQAGQKITYTATVENTGNVTVSNVGFTDDLGTTYICDETTLAPGEKTTCVGEHTVTQADVDAGKVDNSGDAGGTSPSGATVADPSNAVSKTIDADPELESTLAVTGTPTKAGDHLTYTATVKNTGNVTVSDVGFTDDLGITYACLPTSLAPGATATCTSTGHYVVTQGDVNAGTVENSGTGAGTAPSNAAVTDASNDVSTPITSSASLDVDPATSTDPITQAGQEITYTVVVENTGNVTVDDLVVTDELGNTYVCDVTTLAPGEKATCTATYEVTQDDVDAGGVDNTATATATDPSGDPLPQEPSQEVSTPIVADPEVTATLAQSTNTVTKAGDEITYTATVENTGNVTVADVEFTDDLGNTYVCAPTSLAPGQKATCTATYEVTQADVDAGKVDNSGTAAATDPSDDLVTDASNDVTKPIVADPEVTATLAQSTNTVTKAGDEITYTATVENTGNVTVADVEFTDDLGNTYVCAPTSLAPGQKATCTATYEVTQADVDAGKVDNSGTAAATDPSDDLVTDASNDVTKPIDADAELTAALAASGSPAKAGDEITYTATVENTGNVTVADVEFTDDLGNTYVCAPTSLAPGQKATCTATYEVTQADVDTGTVENSGDAAGLDPSDDPVTDASNDAVTPIETGPALTTTVSQEGTPSKAGDEIEYTVVVENTGNVTVDDLVVTDELGNAYVCDVTTLAPGEKATCTATYEVTQDDVDAGGVDNTAAAEGDDPADRSVSSPSNPVSTVIEAGPELTTTVSQEGTPSKAGDEIEYTVVVENTGNVTVDDLVVTDELGNTYVCDVTTLAPGEKATCTATYEVTQADVDAGGVDNTVTGAGTDPAGDSVSDDAPVASTVIEADPELTTTVSQEGTPSEAGDEIEYTVVVENTGNVTVDDLVVTDELGNTYVCDVTTLAPGEKATCTATYEVTQDDVDSGAVENTATGAGSTPSGGSVADVSDQSQDVSTPVAAAPGLRITDATAGVLVDADGDGRDSAGDTVVYTFTVENTGNVTLHDVTVTDALGNVIACKPDPLAPGASATCVSEPTAVTQAQVNAGEVVNAGTASASTPTQASVESDTSDEVTTPLEPTAALSVNTRVARWEDVNGDGKLNAGDRVHYEFDVTNPGTVTVEGVAVTDERLTGQGIVITCTAPTMLNGLTSPSATAAGPTLAPGETTTCSATTGYTLTADDVQKRVVEDSARATGTSAADDSDVTATSNTVRSVPEASPGLSLTTQHDVKDVNGNGVTDAGDEVRYTYVVTNTGDITLEDVAVVDQRLADEGITITCEPTTLKPGESATCTTSGPYVVTDDDVANGRIVDTAVAVGTDPQGGETSAVKSANSEAVLETGVADETAEERTEERNDAPATNDDLASAGGPSAAVGALGLLAVGAGVTVVGAYRRRRSRDDLAA